MSDELTLERIAEMRAGIMPGEWHQRDPDVKSGENIIIDSDSGHKGSAGQPLESAVAAVLNFANFMSFEEGHKRCDAQMRRDAAFIAASPAIVEKLISEVESITQTALREQEIAKVAVREAVEQERERIKSIVRGLSWWGLDERNQTLEKVLAAIEGSQG